MPDRGLLEPGTVRAGTVTAQSALVLEGRWAQMTFEVDQAAALEALPGDVSRPVPAYGRLLVADAGWVRIAALSVGGRYRMLAKNVLVEVVVDGDVAAVAAALGGACRAGSVTLERADGAAHATVADAAGELCRLALPTLRPVDPAMLRWDPWLGFSAGNGGVELVELPVVAEMAAAFLGKGAELTVAPGRDRADRWRRLRSLLPISACYAEGTLNLGPGAVQQSL